MAKMVPINWTTRDLPEVLRRVVTVLAYMVATALVIALGLQIATVPGLNMVELEVAGSLTTASALLGNLRSTPVVVGAIAGDFPFILAYGALLVWGALYFPGRAFRVRRFRTSGRLAAGLVVVAAVINVVENLAMLRGLDLSGDLPWRIAAVMAWPKFTIVIAVAVYIILAVGSYLVTPDWLRHNFDTGDPTIGDRPGPSERSRFGIAASGGGIRSASLVLGSLQALDDAYPEATSSGPSWTTADKVTAISGGSYIAGGFAVSRSERRTQPDLDTGDQQWHRQAWRIDRDPRTGQLAGATGQGPEERRLLTRLGYLLAPNPSGNPSATDKESRDVPGVIALTVVGAVFNLTILLAILWLILQPYAWLLASAPLACSVRFGCLTRPNVVQPVVAWGLAAAAALLVWVGSGWVRAAWRPGSRPYRAMVWLNQRGRHAVLGLVALTVELALMLLVGPTLVAVLPGTLADQLRSLTPAATVAALGTVIALVRGLTGRAVRFAPYVGGALFVVLLTLVAVMFLVLAPTTDQSLFGFSVTPPVLWGAQLVVAMALYSFASAEWWSMAGFYRARLRLAYATYRTKNGTAEAYRNGSYPLETAEPSVYELVPRDALHPDGSPLQVCATAHVTGTKIQRHYGVPAVSVTVGPETFQVNLPENDEGEYRCLRASTRLIENLLYRRGGARLTTMLTVGISGAAISPAMGRFQLGPSRALLAAANIRLGVWVPNPRHTQGFADPGYPRPLQPHRRLRYPRPRISYLLKEMFGIHDIDDVYLYVTDGGHWENTGLVELVRNRDIDEVVCLDADEKPRQTVTQIATAINLAQLECGVRIRLPLDPLRGPGDGTRGADYSPQSVALGVIERGDSVGLLWYAKPVLTTSAPLDLLSYAECDPEFPSTSTVDQFFHTAQFKAYRDLGRHNGREIVIARYELAQALRPGTLEQLVKLAEEPTAHWAVVTAAKLLDYGNFAKVRNILSDLRPLRVAAEAAANWPRPARITPPSVTSPAAPQATDAAVSGRHKTRP